MIHRQTYYFTILLLLCWLTADSVLGRDTRVPIDNTSYFPYNVVSALRYDFDQDGIIEGRASGVLVGPHMVLTCGHCVFDRSSGRYVDLTSTDLLLAPGMYQDGARTVYPYDSRPAVRLRTNDKYMDPGYSPASNVDYGAAFFICPFEELTTYMPLAFDYFPLHVSLNGYPVGGLPEPSQNREQWMDWGPLTHITSRNMTYEPPRSTGGASGSPVWVNHPDGLFQVAVNMGHTNDSNGRGSRLVWQNEWLIGVWMQWKPSFTQLLGAGCSLKKLTWDQLQSMFQGEPEKILSADDLKLSPAAPPHSGGLVVRRIHQFIENNLYRWEEVATDPQRPDGPIGVRMLHPFARPLDVSEARILLSASRRWIDQAPSGQHTTDGHPGPAEEGIPVPVDEQGPDRSDPTLDREAQ